MGRAIRFFFSTSYEAVWPAFFAILSVLITANTAGFAQRSPSTADSSAPVEQTLEINKPIEHELSGAQTDSYRLPIEKDQYAAVVVEQRGIDVTVQVTDSLGALVAEFDSESRKEGKENIALVAQQPGCLLRVRAKYPRMTSGRYQIEWVQVRAATDHDREEFEAHKLATQAQTLYVSGKYDDAVKAGKQALATAESALGTENRYVAEVATILGLLQRTKGNYQDAQAVLQRALIIDEKEFGKEDPWTALTLDYLGMVAASKNDYARAEQYIQEALVIFRKTLGDEHKQVANCLNQIAIYRELRGDYQSAASYFQQALDMSEKILEPDDMLYMGLVANLGDLYLNQGDYERAEPLTERAVAMMEKRFGPDHPRVAGALRNLASIARMKKEYPRALELFSRSQAIYEKALGPQHMDSVSLLINIGNVYKDEGESAKAIEYYQRSLEILEKVAGPYHRLTMMALANLAIAYAAMGDIPKAVEYQSRVDQVVDKEIELNLATGSERQKLAYIDSIFERTDRTISLSVQQAPQNPAAAEMAALAILQRKSRVLDSVSGELAALRQRMKPEDQKLIDELSGTDAQLAKVALNGPGKTPPAEYQVQLRALEERREKLEAAVSEKSAGFYQQTDTVTLSALKAAVPRDAALVEVAVYRPFDPSAPGITERQYGDPRYVAYVIRHEGGIRWTELGSAKDIDKLAADFRRVLQDPAQTKVRQLAREADEKILRPIRALSGNANQLLIAPDGELNLVPFDAMLDEHGHYAVENYSVTYLTTGRELLRMQVRRESKSPPLLVANPAFDLPGAVLAKGEKPPAGPASSRRRSITTGKDLAGVYFAPLSGTEREARAIQKLFPDARLLTGALANKSAIEHIEAPILLHIATHGFFLEDQPTGADSRQPVTVGPGKAEGMENPLLRSGLALAGANSNRAGAGGGILTALEASNMNLWGTKLVTLSACDTGIGDVRNREGVYGLRRAFVLAGAETLVMSLWPVSDDVTREMMTSYYAGLKRGLGRGEALRQTELAMMKRKGREHPFYWASFIQSGEWTNLAGKK